MLAIRMETLRLGDILYQKRVGRQVRGMVEVLRVRGFEGDVADVHISFAAASSGAHTGEVYFGRLTDPFTPVQSGTL